MAPAAGMKIIIKAKIRIIMPKVRSQPHPGTLRLFKSIETAMALTPENINQKAMYKVNKIAVRAGSLKIRMPNTTVSTPPAKNQPQPRNDLVLDKEKTI